VMYYRTNICKNIELVVKNLFQDANLLILL